MKLDDVINDQRKIVYDLRNRILDGEEHFHLLKMMIADAADFLISDTLPEDQDYEPVHLQKLQIALENLLKRPVVLPAHLNKRKKVNEAIAPAIDETNHLIDSYTNNPRVDATIPAVMKSYIDQMWIRHLEAMAHLKEGIGLRSYQQEDPMRIYQREGLELFAGNFQSLRYSISNELLGFLYMLEQEADG